MTNKHAPIPAESNGAKRRRPILASLTTLGVVAALTGVVGVFAAGTDTATTGENDAFTGSLVSGEGDVDLEITAASFDPETGEFACGNEWTDHLTTGVITSNGNDISDQYPGYPFYDEGHVCLRNVGDTTASVTMAVTDIFDTELACSEGEEAHDATCGSGLGELSQHLMLAVYGAAEGTDLENCFDSLADGSLTDAVTDPLSIGTLEPGQTRGFCPGVGLVVEDIAEAELTQTDRTTWRFAFEAVAVS